MTIQIGEKTMRKTIVTQTNNIATIILTDQVTV